MKMIQAKTTLIKLPDAFPVAPPSLDLSIPSGWRQELCRWQSILKVCVIFLLTTASASKMLALRFYTVLRFRSLNQFSGLDICIRCRKQFFKGGG